MGRRIVLDAETDGLLHSLAMFHNIGIKDYDTGEKFMFSTREGNIEEGVKMASEAEAMIGHNVLGFDIPALEMVYPDFDFKGKVRDTLVISRLLWSNRADLDMKLIRAGTLEGRHMGRHNLESWGQRLGDLKGDFSQWCHDRDIDPWGDWGWEGTYEFEGRTIKKKGEEDRIIEPETIHWSDVYDMRTDYCDQDVEVAEKLFDYEMDTVDLWGYSNFPIWCEHRFEEIMGYAQDDGFPLNIEKAETLEAEIKDHLDEFNSQCKEAFPSKFEPQDGYMTVEDVEKMLENLLDKQEKRRVAACQKGKELKNIYDYKPLVRFIDFLKDNEINEIPKIKAAARSSKVTHNMPDGTKFSSVIEAGTVKTATIFKDFNPNSRPQIVEKLLELGWEPEVYTDKGNPSTAGDTLEEAADLIPICKPIAGGLKCTKIKSYIRSKEGAKAQNGWLNVVRDGKIHSRIVHIGAATHRVSLSKPNIGQIPAVEEYPKGHEQEDEPILGFEGGWGLECRDCFEPPKGWWLMGADLSGIEVRLLAEEMSDFDDGEYIDVVLDGDIHETNREAADLPTRGVAKTFLYSVIYGIGDLALGGRLDPSLSEGEKVKLGKNSKKNFFREIPAAKKTVKKYKKEAKNGFITAIDGRRVPCDSGHKALNYRLQNGGAIIAKLWTIYFYDAMLDAGYASGYDGDFVIAAFVHDEIQVPCRTKKIAIHAGEIAEEQSLIVGKFFNISIPIQSKFKIGKSWADTH